MIELLILQTTFFYFFSRKKKYGYANPFTIYFLIWLCVYLGYYLMSKHFNRISNEFCFVLFVSMFFSFLIMVVSGFLNPRNRVINLNSSNRFSFLKTIPVNIKLFKLTVLMVFISSFKAHQVALEITDGISIFSPIGFVNLRHKLTYEGASYGIYAYVTSLSIVTTMFGFVLYKLKKISVLYLIMSVFSSLAYCYFSTGRTFFLMLICFTFMPFFISRFIKIQHSIILALTLIIIFTLIAGLSNKGVSFENNASENMVTFSENIIGYTVAPFVAMATLYENTNSMELGKNSFRFFYAFFNAIGVVSDPPVDLIKPYVETPWITNVYTVFEVYFRDFLHVGFFIVPIFLIAQNYLFVRARLYGGIWIFYYSISVFPLVMMFFQDMYLSLLSTWLQVVFWIGLMSGFKIRNEKSF